MTFDFSLMLRMFVKSIFHYRDSGANFTVRRLAFNVLFPVTFLIMECVHWSCLFLDDLLFPGYRRIKVEKPVFVVGYPRSGSTYLHRLLANDAEHFTSLKLWEILFAPSILQKKFFNALGVVDRKLGNPFYRLVTSVEDKMFAGAKSMHKISHYEAEEDEIILMHIFSSLFLGFLFPFEEMEKFSRFDTDIPERKRKRIMRFYRSCVQRHLYVFGPTKHFLSKNPAFSSKIHSIYETFQDAKIIYLVRHPFDAVPSAISWISYGMSQFNDWNQATLTRKIVALTSPWYLYPLTELDKYPEDWSMITKYQDLVSDPAACVLSVYQWLELSASPSYRALLSDQDQRNKRLQRNHSYSLAQYGLSERQILDAYMPIFDRFGLSPETPESSGIAQIEADC